MVKLEETVKIHPFDDINHVLQSLSRQKVLKAKFSYVHSPQEAKHTYYMNLLMEN